LAARFSTWLSGQTTDGAFDAAEQTAAAVPCSKQGYAAGFGEKRRGFRAGFNWCVGEPLTCCVGWQLYLVKVSMTSGVGGRRYHSRCLAIDNNCWT
jgi:hypothetical protein